jgi:hypothetical protein
MTHGIIQICHMALKKIGQNKLKEIFKYIGQIK